MKKTSGYFILFFFISSCFIYSCKNGESQKNKSFSTLKNEIWADQYFKEYVAINQELEVNIAKGKYNLDSVNYQMVKTNRDQCKTFEELIALYNKAGFKNSREYLTNTYKILDLRIKLQKKYPQLSSLTKEEKTKIFTNISTLRLDTILLKRK